LLSPEELKEPKSKLTGTTPIAKETTHLFIDLKKIEPRLMEWIKKHEKTWSTNATTTTHAWLKEGLRPRCITRDLKWGVPVPKKGHEDKVFYSWFDAPIGYISITAACRDDWKDWWKNPEGCRLVQFMGKDNIPFHTILFPAFCIGTDDNYTLMDTISVNEYINYESGKFSKSRGEGVFCDDAMQTGIPADYWRYYIMINRPEREDSTFDWKDFQEKVNKELLANFGNLVNRTLTFVNRFFDSTVPALTKKELDLSVDATEVAALLKNIEERKALKAIMSVSKKVNQFFQEKKPWELVKTDKGQAENIIANLVCAVRDLAIMIEPYMPQIAKDIFKQLALKPQQWKSISAPIEAGHTINAAAPLFRSLEDKEVEAFRTRFKGKRPQPEKKADDAISFSDIDLKVAKITKVEAHPNAEKLYIEHIDLGTEQRTIVSGLVGHYEPDDLVGKNVVVVTNLKSAKLRGIESQGMLLAAGDKELGLLLAPNAQPGDDVVAKGSKKSPRKEIDIDAFFSVEIVARNGKAYVGDAVLETEQGPLIVDRTIDGLVR
jgi:methionyl-tRNA synthetase